MMQMLMLPYSDIESRLTMCIDWAVVPMAHRDQNEGQNIKVIRGYDLREVPLYFLGYDPDTCKVYLWGNLSPTENNEQGIMEFDITLHYNEDRPFRSSFRLEYHSGKDYSHPTYSCFVGQIE